MKKVPFQVMCVKPIKIIHRNMKKKIAYGVFSFTDSGQDYLVRGNFGDNKALADAWAANNVSRYPNGLIVKKIEY